MFSFLSSKTTRILSRRSLFPSGGSPSNCFGAAIYAASVSAIGFALLLDDNDDSGINTSSVMRRYFPSTETTLTESKSTDNESSCTKDQGEEELFHGQCLKRQMHIPAVPYPLWDYNWDGKMTSDTSLDAFRSGRANASSTKQKRKDGSYQGSNRKGKTRHLLLVRHGQYDERRKEDEYRKLTPLGRLQAIKTGKRLAEMATGSMNFPKDRFNGQCPVKAIHVSDMVRAKETAALIAEQFSSDKIVRTKPDPLLNEALPAPMVPIRPDIKGATEEIDENHDRIEEAFQKYFYRYSDRVDDSKSDENDEFEIIVCHGNVIRYLYCRALQLPPETWLRLQTLNCSITYLVIRPNGMVSARMMGDIGHLDYDESTFSGYHGFKW